MVDTKETGKKLNIPILHWLFRGLLPLLPHLTALTAIQVVTGACAVGYSLIFRNAVDSAVAGNEQGFIRAIAIAAAVTFGQLLLRFAGRMLEETARSRGENLLKARFLDGLLKGAYWDAASVHTGEWMNRFSGDAAAAADGAVQILPQVTGLLVRLIGACAVIVTLEPMFGLWLLAGVAGYTICVHLMRFRIKGLHTRIRETDGVLRSFVQELLENQTIIRVYDSENHTGSEVQMKMAGHSEARRKGAMASNGFSLGFGVVIHGAYLFAAGYCGCGILNGTVSFGTLTALLQLIGQLQAPLSGLGAYLPRWYAMQVSAARLAEPEVFHQEPKAFSDEVVRAFYEQHCAGVEVKDVCFSYPGQDAPVLERLSLKIGKGKLTVLNGPSGCGKSTLIKLLLGFCEPQQGSILLNSETTLTSCWRNLFAYVPQGNHLMSGTIRESLAVYNRAAMEQTEAMWEALSLACADQFVRELEHGLDTPLGESGAGLSEGQLQRLSLARAIFSGRPVLLLDEATSALDEQTETAVLENLLQMKDRTIVLISHHSRAWKQCHHIITLSEEQTT